MSVGVPFYLKRLTGLYGLALAPRTSMKGPGLQGREKKEKQKVNKLSDAIFLQWPGKKSVTPSGWSIPAKISVYLWLGVLQDKKHYIDGLPQGYEVSSELRNADKLRSNAPSTIFYAEKHVSMTKHLLTTGQHKRCMYNNNTWLNLSELPDAGICIPSPIIDRI